MGHRSETEDTLEACLKRLRLTVAEDIENNPNHVVLKCLDSSRTPVVVKYRRSRTRTAERRLTNEALLLRNLSGTDRLRFPKYYAHGGNHLVTEFNEGILLSSHAWYSESLVRTVADALVDFQSIGFAELQSWGIRDWVSPPRYYVQVLLKHYLHLWPQHITLLQVFKSAAIVLGSLPAMLRTRVACHGDFHSSNILCSPDGRSVTFMDLEGFLSRNHPLFDVLSLCTDRDTDVRRWDWQWEFLRYYVDRAAERFGLALDFTSFRKAFRGILTFFSVYRLNETRLACEGTTYFDGLTKRAYARKKILRLLSRRDPPSGAALDGRVEARMRDLRVILNWSACEGMIQRLLGATALARARS